MSFKIKWITIILICCRGFVFGQFSDKLIKNAQKQLASQADDYKLIEVPEAVKQKLFISFDSAFAVLYHQSIKDSLSADGNTHESPEKLSPKTFVRHEKLRDVYHFDLTQVAEIMDYNKKRFNVLLHFSKTEPILGIEYNDENYNTTIIILDESKKYIVRTHITKNGKRSLTSIYAPDVKVLSSKSIMDNCKEIKNNDKKSGLRYYSHMTDTEISNIVSKDFLNTANKKERRPLAELFMPQAYTLHLDCIAKGQIYQYKNIIKEDQNIKTSFITKAIISKPMDIKVAEYR
jgi:hypothetical protein